MAHGSKWRPRESGCKPSPPSVARAKIFRTLFFVSVASPLRRGFAVLRSFVHRERDVVMKRMGGFGGLLPAAVVGEILPDAVYHIALRLFLVT